MHPLSLLKSIYYLLLLLVLLSSRLIFITQNSEKSTLKYKEPNLKKKKNIFQYFASTSDVCKANTLLFGFRFKFWK